MRVTSGFRGNQRSREKQWARAQRARNFADPRIYGPQPFPPGPRKFRSPWRWRNRRFRPVAPRGYNNDSGRNAVVRNGENMLRREQEDRERQISLMQGNPSFESLTRLRIPPRPTWGRPMPPIRFRGERGGRRLVNPTRGYVFHREVLDRPPIGGRKRHPPHSRYGRGGRRGSNTSSVESTLTYSSTDSDSSYEEDFSDTGSFTRVRSPGVYDRGRHSPFSGHRYGGRRRSIESDSMWDDHYERVPGFHGNYPYNHKGYYHSDESFSVFPSASRESW